MEYATNISADAGRAPDVNAGQIEATVYFMAPDAPEHLIQEGAKFELVCGQSYYGKGITHPSFLNRRRRGDFGDGFRCGSGQKVETFLRCDSHSSKPARHSLFAEANVTLDAARGCFARQTSGSESGAADKSRREFRVGTPALARSSRVIGS
jgi:hypothetical protein